MDVQEDIFAEMTFGKIALKKIGKVSDNFRLYEAGWVEDDSKQGRVMKVTGAEFRAAKTGRNKGLLSIMLKDTKKTVYVTREEINNLSVL